MSSAWEGTKRARRPAGRRGAERGGGAPPSSDRATDRRLIMPGGPGRCLKVNWPGWDERPDFRAFLNSPARAVNPNVIATWHQPAVDAVPNEYSDVFTVYDGGEGSDADDLPEDLWKALCKLAEDHGLRYCVFWLTNLD